METSSFGIDERPESARAATSWDSRELSRMLPPARRRIRDRGRGGAPHNNCSPRSIRRLLPCGTEASYFLPFADHPYSLIAWDQLGFSGGNLRHATTHLLGPSRIYLSLPGLVQTTDQLLH